MKYFLLLVVTAWVMCASLAYAAGPATTQAGKYTVVLSSQPSPPVVGSNLLVITVKDGEHPLSGAGVDVHIDMASMPMPADAQATPGAAAGTYGATLNFAMAGRWTVAVRVRQMAGMTMDGDGTAHYLLDTGQGITVPGGGAMPWFTLCVVGVIGATLLAIIGYRWLPWQARGYVAGTLTLLIVLLGTIVVVTKYRDSKTSTVLESATMDMSAQAAPGTTAVATELVQAAPFQASASYTGAVAPEAEEEVYPRVTGRLLSMPWYPGDQITPGQVVAQLDASELAAKDEQARQGSASALQGVAAAQAEMSGAKAGRAKSLRAVEQAEAQLAQVQSAARGADGAVKAAQSEATEARLRATESESAVNAALAGIDQANEAVEEAQSARESAGADAAYWTAEIAREQKLYAQGAIAKEELERETAQAAAAQAKLTQMKAAQRTTEAGVTRAKEEAAQARARQASAQAAIATAESRAEQSQAERESARQKISEAQAAVQTARADVRMAEAQEGVATAKAAGAGASARQAQAALVEAGTVRGYTTLRASLGGLVTARLVAPGTLVQPGTALLKIAKIDVVRLQVNVSAADLGRVRLGQVLTARSLEAQGDAPALLHARISAIFPTRDPSARTAIVEARLANPDARLKPGQYLSVSVPLGDARRKSFTVPSNAVMVRDNQASLFIAASDGLRMRAQRLPVRIGQLSNGRTEITQGLSDGARLIISGLANLQDGDAVTVVQQQASPTPLDGEATAPPTPARSERSALPRARTPDAPMRTSPVAVRTHATPVGHAAASRSTTRVMKTWYRCPMHPEIVSDKPGKCPKCGMDYVPFQKK